MSAATPILSAIFPYGSRSSRPVADLHRRVRQMINQGRVPLLPDNMVLDDTILEASVLRLTELNEDQIQDVQRRYLNLLRSQKDLQNAASFTHSERTFKNFSMIASFVGAGVLSYGAFIAARQSSVGVAFGAAALGITAVVAGVQAGRAQRRLKNDWMDSVRKGTPFLMAREILEAIQKEIDVRQGRDSSAPEISV